MIDTRTAIDLNDATVRNATVPDGKTEIYLKDLKQGGLTVRVRSSGNRAFYFTHTRPGRKGSFRTFIGKFPALNVAAARKQAAKLAGQRADGIDLTLAKRKQKQAALKAAMEAAAVVTLGFLIAEPKDGEEDNCPYAAARKGERIANWKLEMSYLRTLLPAHRNTDIRELRRRDVMAAMDKKLKAGRSGAAGAVWKHYYAFFGWCVERDYIDTNPLANARRKRRGSRDDRLKRKAKEGRALSPSEITAVWAAAGKMDTFGLLVKFCLLTGTRRGEAAKLRWSDLQTDRIVIPAEITKTGEAHEIPRTALLDEVLEAALKFRRASSDLVFPARTGGPVEGFSTRVGRIVKLAAVERWTMHDLRRTTRTTLGWLGFSNEIGRLCVGQKVAPLDRTYNKDDGWDKRCEAFKAYHDHVASLVGGNVISFQDRAKAIAAG